jgi:hypothetical protein
VSIFPTDTLIKLRKETSYINKINKDWVAEKSLSLEANLSNDSSRRVSMFNTHTFLVNGVLLNISLWTTGLSYYLSSYSTNENSQPRIPESGVSYLQWQTTARALTAAPRTDRPGANSIYDLNPTVVESYMTPSSAPLPTRTYKGPNYWDLPIQEFEHLAVMGTNLGQLHPKRIDYTSTDAVFQANDKVYGFYQKDNKLGYYEFHHSEGARGLHELALNPKYNYMPWKLTQADASTYLLPYVYKKDLYFVRLQVEQQQ